MKKIIVLIALFVTIPLVHAQESVITLYDDTLELEGCNISGSDLCSALDNASDASAINEVRISRFVPGSGYLAFYFRDLSDRTAGFNGGLDLASAYFEPNSGGRVQIGASHQVFERGNVVVEFEQPYTSNQRLDTEYELVLYYLPHSEGDRQGFLIQLQDDPAEFLRYKDRQAENIDRLCDAIGDTQRPSVCPGSGVSSGGSSSSNTTFDSGTSSFVTDPGTLPELDFSGRPSRAPIVTLRDEFRQTFVNEPVVLEVTEVYDPDGKCQFYSYNWQKSDDMSVRDVTVDPRLGDLFFVPQNVGVFTVRLRAQEACAELGTLTSEVEQVRIIVNDKSTAFPDIQQAGEYQNAIYELYHLGVVQGYPDGTMRPLDPINRAEFLKIVFEALQLRISDEVFSPRYADVLPGVWYEDYIYQADVLGVIEGYPDGLFHPEWEINLVEALKIAMNFTTLDIKTDLVYSFRDVDEEEWYVRYLKTAFREGIVDNIEPGGYARPGKILTRAEAMSIVVRTLIYPVNRISYTNRDVLRRPEQFEDFTGSQNP